MGPAKPAPLTLGVTMTGAPRKKKYLGAVDLGGSKILSVIAEGDGWTYWQDPTRPDSRTARLAVDDALQRAAGRGDVRDVTRREMTVKGQPPPRVVVGVEKAPKKKATLSLALEID